MRYFERYTYEWHEQVDSTMNLARMWATNHNQSPARPHFIQAGTQSRGRGKGGRVWYSERGNFFGTLVLHFPFSLKSRGQMSFVTGVSMVEALLSLIPDVPVQLKWPNDFYIGPHKLGGILLEFYDQEVPYMGIGIGLNIVSAPNYILATNLFEVTQINRDVHEIREHFMKKMLYNFNAWQRDGFFSLKKTWIQSCIHVGQSVRLTHGQNQHQGTFHTIDDDGALVLKDEDGHTKTFSTGDVFFDKDEL